MDPQARIGSAAVAVQRAFLSSPLGQHVSSSVEQIRTSQNRRRIQCHPPRIVCQPRDPRFAAILPGDGVAEQVRSGGVAELALVREAQTSPPQVITTGLSNFLNLYNSALILRLVLTWFPSVPEQIVNPLA